MLPYTLKTFLLEFVKLNGVLKLENVLSKFLIDYAAYKGRYDDALIRVQEANRSLAIDIRAASVLYIKKNYTVMNVERKISVKRF